MPGLVALDVDGTVLDHDGRLTDRVRDAVRAVADSGAHVVIATGVIFLSVTNGATPTAPVEHPPTSRRRSRRRRRPPPAP